MASQRNERRFRVANAVETLLPLLVSAQGRIASGPFWIGAIALIVLGVVLGAVQTYGPQNLGLVIPLVVLYPGVCVYVKRFHDAGRSGWWSLAVVVVGFALAGGAILWLALPNIAELQGQHAQPGSPEFIALQRQMASDVFLPVQAATIAIQLVLAFIVGLLPSDRGENRFGPPTGAAPPAAV